MCLPLIRSISVLLLCHSVVVGQNSLLENHPIGYFQLSDSGLLERTKISSSRIVEESEQAEFLKSESIRREISLGGSLSEALREYDRQRGVTFGGFRKGALEFEAAKRVLKTAKERINAAIDEELTDVQRKRLRQLVEHHYFLGFGPQKYLTSKRVPRSFRLNEVEAKRISGIRNQLADLLRGRLNGMLEEGLSLWVRQLRPEQRRRVDRAVGQPLQTKGVAVSAMASAIRQPRRDRPNELLAPASLFQLSKDGALRYIETGNTVIRRPKLLSLQSTDLAAQLELSQGDLSGLDRAKFSYRALRKALQEQLRSAGRDEQQRLLGEFDNDLIELDKEFMRALKVSTRARLRHNFRRYQLLRYGPGPTLNLLEGSVATRRFVKEDRLLINHLIKKTRAVEDQFLEALFRVVSKQKAEKIREHIGPPSRYSAPCLEILLLGVLDDES